MGLPEVINNQVNINSFFKHYKEYYDAGKIVCK